MDSSKTNPNRSPDRAPLLRKPTVVRTWDVSPLTTGVEPIPLFVLSGLNEHESARAGRYKKFSAYAHFVLSRYFLRSQLSSILGSSDGSVRISYGRFGKPFIEGCSVEFNLSHSDGLIALAVSSSPIGIDVERNRNLTESDDLVEEFFSAGERAWIAPMQGDARSEAILSIWTMKEAMLKAWGCGLHYAPKRLTLTPPWSTLGRWSVRTLETNPRYLISVAGLTGSDNGRAEDLQGDCSFAHWGPKQVLRGLGR